MQNRSHIRIQRNSIHGAIYLSSISYDELIKSTTGLQLFLNIARLSVEELKSHLLVEKCAVRRKEISTMNNYDKDFEFLFNSNSDSCASADYELEEEAIKASYKAKINSLSDQKSSLDIKIGLAQIIFTDFLINLANTEQDLTRKEQIWSFIEIGK
jgi:hypothetical protein